MKTQTWFLIIFIGFGFASCLSDVYLNFTEDEKELFFYEVGDQISFYREPQNDTILFNVISKEVLHKNTYGYMTIRDYYAHVCSTKFEGGDYKGEIIFVKESIGDLISLLTVSKGSNSIFSGDFGIDSDSIQYVVDYYYHSRTNDSLLYSKDRGIVKFTTSFPEEEFTLIE